MIFSKFFNYLSLRKLALIITILYTTIIIIVLLNRFWQYEVFYYDHGMTESTAWQISHFKIPLHYREFGKKIIYVDHLYPTLQLVLAPFYWINNSYETPIIIFGLLTGFSILIGFEIANKLIKNKLMVYALLFAFMFYIGLQNAIIFFLHDITFSIFFTMLLFLSIVINKKRLYWFSLILTLGCKESLTLMTAALAISLFFFYKKSWRREAVITLIISITYGFLAAKIIIPYFKYISFGAQGTFSNTPEISLNLKELLYRFISNDAKRETIFTSITTFGFLPIMSFFSLPLFIQDLAQRFVLLAPYNSLRQGLNLHYNANLAVLLFIGSVFTVVNLQKIKWYKKIINYHALLIILTTAIYHELVYHGPLGLIYNKDFFKITKNMRFMDNFVKKIPTEGKIMIQNNLAVRFTHKDIYILSDINNLKAVDPDVVALDFRPGQNINNFWPSDYEKMERISLLLTENQNYRLIFKSPYRFIFVKKNYQLKRL